jgi:hypothetical protein
MPPRKLIAFGIVLVIIGVGIGFAGNFLSNPTLIIVAIPVALSGVGALMPRPENLERFDRELKSEERRAVILLGFLGAFIAFDFWLRDSDPKANPYFNFVCNYPCPHVTFYWIPFLDNLIYLWFLWAGCALIYFSDDAFHWWALKRQFKQVFRNLGHGFLILWPLLFAWTVIYSEAAFLLEKSAPAWILTIYAFFGIWVLVALVLWLVETVTGAERGNMRLLWKAYFDLAHLYAEFLVYGLLPAFEIFARRFLKDRIPPKLKIMWFTEKRILLNFPKTPKQERKRWRIRKSKASSPRLPQHPI